MAEYFFPEEILLQTTKYKIIVSLFLLKRAEPSFLTPSPAFILWETLKPTAQNDLKVSFQP